MSEERDAAEEASYWRETSEEHAFTATLAPAAATGLTRGGGKRHAVNTDNPDRALCGYLIPDDRSDDGDVTCSVCNERLALASEDT